MSIDAENRRLGGKLSFGLGSRKESGSWARPIIRTGLKVEGESYGDSGHVFMVKGCVKAPNPHTVSLRRFEGSRGFELGSGFEAREGMEVGLLGRECSIVSVNNACGSMERGHGCVVD